MTIPEARDAPKKKLIVMTRKLQHDYHFHSVCPSGATDQSTDKIQLMRMKKPLHKKYRHIYINATIWYCH